MSRVKTILITGSSGFIAGHLAAILNQESCRVVGVDKAPVQVPGLDKVYEASLLDSLEHVFSSEHIDVVIHCANHWGDDEFEINVRGTTRWLEEAKAHGASLQVFLSSLSAKSDAIADYGRAKYHLENPFISNQGVVFRLGLVVGNGGMFDRIKQSMKKSPFVPLIDNGRQNVHVLGVTTLSYIIKDCVLTNGEGLRGRVWQIHQPQSYTLRDVMEGIREQFGYSCHFVPLPSLPILWAVSLVEKLRVIKLPISSTNLKGLRQSQNENFPSDFSHFGYPEQNLQQLISNAAEAERLS